jgi:hypothetical protein
MSSELIDYGASVEREDEDLIVMSRCEEHVLVLE